MGAGQGAGEGEGAAVTAPRKLPTLDALYSERTEARAERDAARQALADAAVEWQRASAELAGELSRLRGIETAARVWLGAAGSDGPEACTDLIAALDAPRPSPRLDARYFVTVARMVLDPVDHRARHALDTAPDALARDDGPPAMTEVERCDAGLPCDGRR